MSSCKKIVRGLFFDPNARLYCLGMGRPASIQEFNITTPKPKAEDLPLLLPEQEKVDMHRSWPTSQITDNAMQMCEIFIITSEVMDQMCGVSIGSYSGTD